MRDEKLVCKYDGECKLKFDQVALQSKATNDALKVIQATVEDIHKRLFVGNGDPSVMVRIDRTEQIQKVLVWAIGIAGGTVIVAIVGVVLMHLGR